MWPSHYNNYKEPEGKCGSSPASFAVCTIDVNDIFIEDQVSQNYIFFVRNQPSTRNRRLLPIKKHYWNSFYHISEAENIRFNMPQLHTQSHSVEDFNAILFHDEILPHKERITFDFTDIVLNIIPGTIFLDLSKVLKVLQPVVHVS